MSLQTSSQTCPLSKQECDGPCPSTATTRHASCNSTGPAVPDPVARGWLHALPPAALEGAHVAGALTDVAVEFLDHGVGLDAAGGAVNDMQALKGAHTAEGHVRLALLEDALQAELNAVQGEPLALVDSEGPCQLQGNLPAAARSMRGHEHLLLELLG
eukprot:scaffold300_cov375-Prasinococcus_capsulatus_cf.AAC.2